MQPGASMTLPSSAARPERSTPAAMGRSALRLAGKWCRTFVGQSTSPEVRYGRQAELRGQSAREPQVTKLVYEVNEEDVVRARNQLKAALLYSIDSTGGERLVAVSERYATSHHRECI